MLRCLSKGATHLGLRALPPPLSAVPRCLACVNQELARLNPAAVQLIVASDISGFERARTQPSRASKSENVQSLNWSLCRLRARLPSEFPQPWFGIFSASIASAASSFLSICGSGLSSPACNKQCLPASTPHVGQGTASNSCGVSSAILTDQAYCDPYRKTVQIGTDSRLRVIGYCQK